MRFSVAVSLLVALKPLRIFNTLQHNKSHVPVSTFSFLIVASLFSGIFQTLVTFVEIRLLAGCFFDHFLGDYDNPHFSSMSISLPCIIRACRCQECTF